MKPLVITSLPEWAVLLLPASVYRHKRSGAGGELATSMRAVKESAAMNDDLTGMLS